jgi:hypothetical protein
MTITDDEVPGVWPACLQCSQVRYQAFDSTSARSDRIPPRPQELLEPDGPARLRADAAAQSRRWQCPVCSTRKGSVNQCHYNVRCDRELIRLSRASSDPSDSDPGQPGDRLPGNGGEQHYDVSAGEYECEGHSNRHYTAAPDEPALAPPSQDGCNLSGLCGSLAQYQIQYENRFTKNSFVRCHSDRRFHLSSSTGRAAC